MSSEQHRTTRKFFVLAVVALGICAATILLLHERGYTLLDARHLMFLLTWIPTFLLLRRLAPSSTLSDSRAFLPWIVWSMGLVLFLFSSVTRHSWFYFFSWVSDPPSIQARAWWFATITLLALPFVIHSRVQRHLPKLLWLFVLFSLILATATFFQQVGLGLILKDDHPAFAFRLWELRHVPFRRLNYNPWFNGGVVESHPQITGSYAPFYSLMPLWMLFPIERVYTVGFAILFLWVVPLLAAASVRWIRGDSAAQATAALLAQGVSLHYYLWLLHFGTLGACLVAALLVPVSALSYRIVILRKVRWFWAFLLAIFTFLMLCYPPGLIMVLPLIISTLLAWKRWTLGVWKTLLIVVAIVALLHWPSINAIVQTVDLAKAASPTARSFIPSQVSNPWSLEGLQDGATHLLYHFRQMHPLLIFFGIGVLFLSPYRRLALWYLPLVLGLAWFTGWGRLVFPGLQLTRMAIPLAFALVVPTAAHLSKLLRIRNVRHAWMPAVYLSLLILTSVNHVYILGGRTFLKYFGQPPEHHELVSFIATNVPADMRVLFAGRTVHGFGGGHVSIIPAITQREIMACDYYHFDPHEVEYDYPPRPFRASREGWVDFLDMYNVGVVLTYHDNWKAYFDNHQDLFEPAGTWGESPAIYGYRVLRSSNGRLWKGAGTALATFNEIRVKLDSPHQNEVILGYNWNDKLITERPAEIFPYDTGAGPVLIGVRPNNTQEVVIKFSPSRARRRQSVGITTQSTQQ